MPLILGTNSIKDTGYDVVNSCRFNNGFNAGGDDAYMHRTPASAGNRRTFTLSAWIKRGAYFNDEHPILAADTTSAIRFSSEGGSNSKINIYYYSGGWVYRVHTNAEYRDPSAWMHLVVAFDTTQATASNRIKIYVNGTQVTSMGNSDYPSENYDTAFNNNVLHTIGRNGTAGDYYEGYLSEMVMIDGQALDPTSFGEFDEDTGIWKPIDVSGLTFGTNGFYLDFEDSGNLGNDANGGTDFTEVNLAATDQTTDTCTNNFATLNPLDNYYAASTFSEGNCKIVTTSGNITYNTSTIGFSSGKWYIENKVGTSSGSVIGVVRGVSTGNNNDNKIGNRSDGWGYDYRGLVEHNGSDLGGSFATYSAGDIIGVYIDLDNNELYFAKNGTLQNSGTGLALTAGTYFFATGDNNSGVAITHEVNFGNPTFSISSGNTDAGGYGNFEYDPSSGTFDSASKDFLALCTKNLAEYG